MAKGIDMRRPLLLLVLTFISLYVPGVEKSLGQSLAGLQVCPDTARSTYEVEIKKVIVAVEQHFTKLDKTAALINDPDLKSRIAAERAYFGKVLELPTGRQRFVTVHAALLRSTCSSKPVLKSCLRRCWSHWLDSKRRRELSSLKILFLHGWHSIPGDVKPTYLKDYGYEFINPALDDK